VFIDSRRIAAGTEVRTSVCVVGAGVAGIALALEFERAGIGAVVLESGGLRSDAASADLYRGENRGLPYVFADGSRYRYFGGSSNGWAGYCRPLADIDFERREWIPDSGWPIDGTVLDPHMRAAHELLDLGPLDYGLAEWVARLRRADVFRLPLAPESRLQDLMSRFSVPTSFRSRFKEAMQRARHVGVYLHANATNIELMTESAQVRCIEAKTLGGGRFSVVAQCYVLACGGIENARLLLASNRQLPEGLGNRYDLVGRYFADHPWLTVGRLRYSRAFRDNRLYDRMHQNKSKDVAVDGRFFGAQLALTPETQRRERILNAHLNLASIFRGADSRSATAWIRLARRVKGLPEVSSSLVADLRTLALTPSAAVTFALARRLRLFGDLHLEVVCEPTPNRNSRVTLSRRMDGLGMPRVVVDWQMDDLVKRSVDRTAAIAAEELEAAGIGQVELFTPLLEAGWPTQPPAAWRNLGSWHHMGTTRMHSSPSHGVVDRNARLHDVENLFVAGSSVFPTYGANFPTLTIAALAIRLAAHIGSIVEPA
jgi:choline dehydrogenase-like flavoprotein